jgi:hypothetical protein
VLHVPVTEIEFNHYQQNALANKKAESIIRSALCSMFGSLITLKINNISYWCLSSSLAEKFAKGRTVLCGDSAHSLPPSGGFGMNMGIADAHNLAHKLNYFNVIAEGHELQNKDGLLDELINVYSSEREEGTSLFLNLSNENLDKNLKVAKNLGLSYKNLDLLDKTVSSFPFIDQFSFLSIGKKLGSIYLDFVPAHILKINSENLLALNFFRTETSQSYAKSPILEIAKAIEKALGLEPDARFNKTLLHHAQLQVHQGDETSQVHSRDLWQLLASKTSHQLPFIFLAKNIVVSELSQFSKLGFQVTSDTGKPVHSLIGFDDCRLDVDMRFLARHYDLADADRYLIIIRSDGFIESVLKSN